MKKSELKSFIKEEITNILNEVTVVDKNTKPEDVKGEDPITVKSAIDIAKKTQKPVNIAEEDEDGEDDENKMHRDALKGAKAAKGKGKKLDTAIKALSIVKKEMKTLVNQYKSAEGEEKQKLVSDLKTKTNIKKELEALVSKLEQDVV
mgnify:CR=1 FL=1